MNFAEFDALVARKNAGSRSRYFELLDAFTKTVPTIISDLAALSNSLKWKEFSRLIDSLQKRLLEVGASELVWEAEKVHELAREGEAKKRDGAMVVLAEKLEGLCLKIREAKTEQLEWNREGHAGTPIPDLGDVISEKGDRIRVGIKPEAFEKLYILIENFELDKALEMLNSLLEFTYTPIIDETLAATYRYLSSFDYESTFREVDKMVEIAQFEQSAALRSAKKRILAIDDMPDVLNTVKAVLNEQYSVYGVTNHRAALKFLTNNKADLILLDIEMPDMNGFALLGIIRKMSAYENTPVLFLSGNVSMDNVKRSYLIGADDFIRKPIDSQILLGKIKEYLDSDEAED